MRRVLACAAVLASTLLATASYADTLEPTHISLPSGPGSIEGMGKSFSPSLASGTASYGVDIAVPPSASDFAPHLSLDYDSGGGESDLGIGWRLSGIPSVRRRTENGLPKFDASDAIEITGLGIPCDLLEIASGTYRPEFESGAFVRVQQTSDGWQARDRSGTTYNFGGGDSFTEAEGANVATWLLRETIDLHGHRIEYAWDTTGGHGKLTSVTWNSYGASAENLIALTYETRPDPHTNFSNGIKETLTERLKTVDVKHGGALVRRYELAYAPGNHSQLATVDLVGRDGASKLPTLAMTYTQASLATSAGQITAMATPPGRSPSDPNVAISDLDGDGLPDLLVTIAGQYRSYQNSDGNSWLPGVDWASTESPSVVLGATGVQLADLNGDGAIDLVVKSGTDDLRYFPGNTATSFAAPVEIATVPDVTFEDPDTKLVDMDGDRRIDVAITTEAGLAIGYNLNGTDWSAPAIVGLVDPKQPLRFSDGGHTQLCDVNGDRVEDFCYLTPGSLVYWLGRGRGVFEPAAVATGVPTWDPSSPWELHDLDGDGWLDIAHVGIDEIDYALATGEGQFGAPASIQGTPEIDPTTTVVRWADMNGSGTTDIVWIDVSGSASSAWQYLELFPNGRAGLLRTIDNGIGRVTTVTYAPASLDAAAARAAGSPWTTRLNAPIPVVKRVDADDSLGDPLVTTDYTYANGTWSPLERVFAGFGGGTETDVGDQSTPTLVTESTFDVGIVDRTQRGLVVAAERRDASGTVFDDVATTYTGTTLEAAVDGRVVKYTYKTAEQTTHVEGTQAPRVTLVEYQQDAYGNVTTESRWGEVVGTNKTAGNDEAITLRTFANDTDDWILGRVATEELQSAAGVRARMTRTYYDGLPLGQLARGDVTRREAWVGPDPSAFDLDVTTSYDADGHPLETTDARGGGHTFSWDTQDHTTLLGESVKLGSGVLTETAQTDRAFGTLTSVTGYNEQTTALAYDAFGRLVAIAKPGDTLGSPTLSFSYDEGAPLSRVTTDQRVFSGQDAVEHAEAVVDGFGRKRATFALDDGGKWALSGVGLLDARGNVRRSLQARFATAAERASPPLLADGPGVDTVRDALGRTVGTTTELGIQTKTSYAPFVTQTWDGGQTDSSSPYEHTPHVETVDGLGRTVSSAWTLGGASLSATFTYDAAGDLVTKTDPEAHVSSYAYDGRGRRTVVNDPDTGTHSFVFDATGNLTEHHKPDGNILRYTFDLAGRPLADDWNGDGVPEVTRDYDVGGPLFRGLLAAVHDPSGGAIYDYDARQRVTRTRYAIGDGTYDVASDYDDQDREYLHVYPDQSSIRIQRSARGLVSGYGQAVTVAYDADNAEMQRAFNTGVVEVNGYDADRRRVETKVTAPSGVILQHLKWTLDGASNVLGVGDLRPGIEAAKDRSETYAYDNLYRLSTASGTWGQTKWTYSPSGNLLSRASSETSQDMGTYGYGGAGPHAPTSVKGRAIRYDAVGRMLDDGDRAYTWDGADHLTKVTRANGAAVESTFDASGARRQKMEADGTGAVHTTRFLDAWSEIDDGQLVRFIVHGGQRIAKLSPTNGVPGGSNAAAAPAGDASEDPPARRLLAGVAMASRNAALLLIGLLVLLATARWQRRRVVALVRLGLPLVGIALVGVACHGGGDDGPQVIEGTVHTLSDADELMFADAIGSLTETASGTGAANAAFAAYPGGLTRYDTASETRKFANTPRDEGVGLDQMGARSYAADLGVWTSVDPLTAAAPESLVGRSFGSNNPYAYGGLNPESRTDANGQMDVALALRVAAGAVAAAPAGGGTIAAAAENPVTWLIVAAVGVPVVAAVITRDDPLPQTYSVAPASSVDAPQVGSPPASDGSAEESEYEHFGVRSVDPTGEPYEDPAPPDYAYPAAPVVDHIHNRARGGSDDDPENLDGKTHEANSRKAGFEGNYEKDKQGYMEQGLSAEQAEHVLQGEHEYIVNDVHARPVDPAALDELPNQPTGQPGQEQ